MPYATVQNMWGSYYFHHCSLHKRIQELPTQQRHAKHRGDHHHPCTCCQRQRATAKVGVPLFTPLKE